MGRPPPPHPQPVQIERVDVDIVNCYKYLDRILDNKLDWSLNTIYIYRKGNSRLYFLRRLQSFNSCRKLLRMFYQSVVASVLFYAVMCWGQHNKKVLFQTRQASQALWLA